jgi:hypothetical protein
LHGQKAAGYSILKVKKYGNKWDSLGTGMNGTVYAITIDGNGNLLLFFPTSSLTTAFPFIPSPAAACVKPPKAFQT